MTSLTGSAGEDFASILRALGYRMEKRPPLPPAAPKPVAATTPIEAVATDAVSSDAVASDAPAEDAIVATEQVAEEPAIAIETQEIADITNDAPAAEEVVASPSASLLPDVDLVPNVANEAAAVGLQPDPATAVAEAAPSEEAAPVEAAVDTTEPVAVEASAGDAEPVATEASESAAEAGTPVEAAAPELVEVWRPGGRSEERRPPRHDRNRHQRNANPSNAAAPAEGEAVPADGARRERTGDRPN